VFPARYKLNSYIVFRKRLVSKRLIFEILNIFGYNYNYLGEIIRVNAFSA
jgi:hypothetical protein